MGKNKELNSLFVQMVGGYQACMVKILKKFKLYVGQPAILFLLQEKTDRTQNELAKELGVSKATIGVSLRRMENAGLVNRVTDARDARCIRVSLTDKGVAMCSKCRDAFQEVYNSMFNGFSAREQKEMAELFGKLNTGLVAAQKHLSGK